MPELKEIKSNEELNVFAAETETKLKTLEDTYTKKFEELVTQKAKDDEEAKKQLEENTALHEKENVEHKAALELTQTQLKEVKEVLRLKYSALSEDERIHKIGQFLLAAKNGDIKAVYEMGGKLNVAESSGEWKGKEWNMKAAPDVGTPLRGDATTGSYLVCKSAYPVSNGRMKSSQIRGNLSLIDMAIPSEAICNNGTCRDLTGAIPAIGMKGKSRPIGNYRNN